MSRTKKRLQVLLLASLGCVSLADCRFRVKDQPPVVEVKRVVAMRDVPASAYPPPQQGGFGDAGLPARPERGDFFLLIETNGGRGSIEWSLEASVGSLSNTRGFIFATGKSSLILLRTLVIPGDPCEKPKAPQISAQARVQQSGTEATANIQLGWSGDCQHGHLSVAEHADTYDRSKAYFSCAAAGDCRLINASAGTRT